MTQLTLTVYGKAEQAGSKVLGVSKHGRRFVKDDNPAAKDWKRTVAQAAGARMEELGLPLMEGPLFLSVTFYRPRPAGHFNSRRELGAQGRRMPFPTTKPDTTKLVRALEDALTGVVWRDDSQVVEQIARKVYGEPSRCEIDVRPADPADADHLYRTAAVAATGARAATPAGGGEQLAS